MKLKEKARALKKKTSALWLALKRKDTPWYAKAAVAVTVAYALSPIDLIPDFIPLLGYLDDIILLPLMIKLCIKLIPADIMSECTERAEGMWADGKPKRWRYAVPIIIIWTLIIAFVTLKILEATGVINI